MLLQKITFFSFVLTLVLSPLAQAATNTKTKHPLDSTTIDEMIHESKRRIDATMEAIKALVQQQARKEVLKKGCTPEALLISIVKAGSERLLQNLLETDELDVDYIDEDGNRALTLAVENGSLALVQMLLDTGADTMLHNGRGFSALHIAAQNGCEDIVIALLNKSLRPRKLINTTDKYHQTPITLAIGRDHHAIVELFLQCGAHVDLNEARGYVNPTDEKMIKILETYLL